jgi:hypothetical protein
MKAISKQTYELRGGIHNQSPLGLTTEKFWYAHDSGRLGIVLLDNVDHDWSFVALAHDPRKPHGMAFRCYDVAASFATPDEAQAALATALAQEPDPVFYTEAV